MRKLDKYGRRMTDGQCVLCQKVDSIFGFTMYSTATDVCHQCAQQAIKAALAPHYPVPSIYCLSLISNRCDQRSNDVAMIGFMAWWYITNAEGPQ